MGWLIKSTRNLALLLLAFWLAAQFVPPAKIDIHRHYEAVPRFESIAHGMGQGLRPNNTLESALYAVKGGAHVLEMDIHLSKDGVLVVRHDDTIDATTDGTGAIKDFTLAELQQFDAGYRFDPDGNQTFPWRGKNVVIPTLETILTNTTGHRYVIEMKANDPAIVPAFCAMIRQFGIANQVLAASFHDHILDDFRQTCPEVATSFAKNEARNLILAHKIGLGHIWPIDGHALQVPPEAAGLTVMSPDFVRAMQARNLRVHVWTINEKDAMQRLIAMGADGIITDFPRRAIAVYGQN